MTISAPHKPTTPQKAPLLGRTTDAGRNPDDCIERGAEKLSIGTPVELTRDVWSYPNQRGAELHCKAGWSGRLRALNGGCATVEFSQLADLVDVPRAALRRERPTTHVTE